MTIEVRNLVKKYGAFAALDNVSIRVADGELRVLARYTPPRWPFPKDIPLTAEHFMQLRPVTGERARRLAALELIQAAFSHAGAQAPAWLSSHTGTLRACVKRAQPWPWKSRSTS